MIKVTPNAQDVAATLAGLEAVKATTRGAGLEAMLALALGRLDRFVAGNIEVDTGRTKNSIFQHTGGNGNRLEAMLGTNVHYAPYVREAGHGEQFFEYAARVEGPAVLEMLGTDYDARIEAAF